MADTVYVLGAGINRGITDRDGSKPPLATDFFQQALKHGRTGDEYYLERIKPLLEYIQRFWKLSATELKELPFDLEACYALIDSQIGGLKHADRQEEHAKLLSVEYMLTALLAEYLQAIEYSFLGSDAFRTLGQIIHAEKPAVLSFNYDTLLEHSIELASGVTGKAPESFHRAPPESGEVPQEELAYSHFRWNRTLAYGARFDEVQLPRAGISTFVPCGRFYSHTDNTLYDPPLLKLHGSINWFLHTNIRRWPLPSELLPEARTGDTVIFDGHWWLSEPPDRDGWVVRPVIVTPVPNKLINELRLLNEIWTKARTELATCRRLIVGGYSFPATDFHTRRLFLEAFSEHTLEELAVINPDTNVVALVKELCHFEKPVVVCKNLDEYLSLWSPHVAGKETEDS